MPLPTYYLIRTLSPALASMGAKRGDYLVDRHTERDRFAVVRPIPAATAEHGIADWLSAGHLERVGGVVPEAERVRTPLSLVR